MIHHFVGVTVRFCNWKSFDDGFWLTLVHLKVLIAPTAGHKPFRNNMAPDVGRHADCRRLLKSRHELVGENVQARRQARQLRPQSSNHNKRKTPSFTTQFILCRPMFRTLLFSSPSKRSESNTQENEIKSVGEVSKTTMLL